MLFDARNSKFSWLHVSRLITRICLQLLFQDYSSGILLDANENSIGPAVTTHEHLELNRFVSSGLSMHKLINLNF